jgi:hypothetical protein
MSCVRGLEESATENAILCLFLVRREHSGTGVVRWAQALEGGLTTEVICLPTPLSDSLGGRGCYRFSHLCISCCV